jgi:hypothetical protein
MLTCSPAHEAPSSLRNLPAPQTRYGAIPGPALSRILGQLPPPAHQLRTPLARPRGAAGIWGSAPDEPPATCDTISRFLCAVQRFFAGRPGFWGDERPPLGGACPESFASLPPTWQMTLSRASPWLDLPCAAPAESHCHLPRKGGGGGKGGRLFPPGSHRPGVTPQAVTVRLVGAAARRMGCADLAALSASAGGHRTS